VYLSRLPEFSIRTTTRHGILSYSNKDAVIGRTLFETGEFEYDKIQKAIVLARDIGALGWRSSGYLIDIGANIGTVCITMIRERTFELGLALEPEPRNFRHLVRNIRRNRLSSSIRAFQLALSSSDGRLDLELSRDNFGDHRIRGSAPQVEASYFGEPERGAISVPSRRLDDFLDELAVDHSRVSLLWIDVQGYELPVLKGAEGVLAHQVPVVMEFAPYWLAKAGISQQEFCAYFTSHFTWYYDLGEIAPQRRRASDVGSMFERYTHLYFSDFLVLA